MATYKDDLDIIKAAESDNKSMTLNAITELDNKGLLGKYGGEGGGSIETVIVQFNNTTQDIDAIVGYIRIIDSNNRIEADGVNLGAGVSTTISNIVKNSIITCSALNTGFSNPLGEITLLSDTARALVSGNGSIDIIELGDPK